MAMSLTVEHDWTTDGRLFRNGYGNLGIYATGGIALPEPRFIELGIIDDFAPRFANGVWYEWNKTTRKVLAWTQNELGAIDEVADATDMTNEVFRWQAHGAF